ncbi:MAG: PEP-CTERM sorting domain-containing protein [Candidatus Brocadiia bacterium]
MALDQFRFIPEPTTVCLMGAGLALLARRRRRRG